MKSSVFALALALGLILSLGGCEEKARPSSQTPTEPSSIEVRGGEPESSIPEETASGIPQADDALVREIVLVYGAEENTYNGPVRLVPTAISFYNRTEPEYSWEGGESLSPGSYFSWFFSTTMKEDYEYKLEAYKNPRTEDGGWFYPQEVYEERVQRYFQVSTEHLRSDPIYYHEEDQAYYLEGGGGKGETPQLSYTYSQEGDILTVVVAVDSPSSSGRHTLTVRLEEGGGWKYLADKVEQL
jgi:hypothetical protein